MMIREKTNALIQCMDEGLLDKDQLILACLNYMSEDDVADMARTEGFLDELDELEEDDGQPDEAQEWHDFDPDC